MDAQQNAQINDMQQQQQDIQRQPAPPQTVYQQAAPAAAPGATTDEKIAQLKQLGELHDAKVLTDAEFEAEKQKILGS
jgi:Short C-terminal domain